MECGGVLLEVKAKALRSREKAAYRNSCLSLRHLKKTIRRFFVVHSQSRIILNFQNRESHYFFKL